MFCCNACQRFLQRRQLVQLLQLPLLHCKLLHQGGQLRLGRVAPRADPLCHRPLGAADDRAGGMQGPALQAAGHVLGVEQNGCTATRGQAGWIKEEHKQNHTRSILCLLYAAVRLVIPSHTDRSRAVPGPASSPPPQHTHTYTLECHCIKCINRPVVWACSSMFRSDGCHRINSTQC